ncbi:MAG: 4Fe-4S dicluster domain-containing protein [Candidatus Brocadiae bacterium]|nr:4Fe-4S dicluster domain-containing protein [Candidatus Brocadiia bacterium]
MTDAAAQPKRTGRVLRAVGRCCALAIATLLVLPVLPAPWTAVVPAAASPYVAVCSVIAARALGWVALLALPVLVLAFLRPRWFCRHACPVGLLLEVVGWLRPSARRHTPRLPAIGQWLALLTLGAALVGYPLFLWLDPLALFTGFVGAAREPFGVAWLVGAGLPVVLLLGLLVPNLWCARLCPLGATQDLLAALKRLVWRRDAAPSATRRALARRSVLAMGMGAVCGAGLVRRARAAAIRPPGAVDEARFTGLCIRCGNCMRACPSEILHPDVGDHGVASFLTPVARFDHKHCVADCTACTHVCPSGAIRPVAPEQKATVFMGIARVDAELCVLSQDMDCAACVQACPYGAVEPKFDEDTYVSSIAIDASTCTGCGACEVACYTTPKKAIVVTPR